MGRSMLQNWPTAFARQMYLITSTISSAQLAIKQFMQHLAFWMDSPVTIHNLEQVYNQNFLHTTKLATKKQKIIWVPLDFHPALEHARLNQIFTTIQSNPWYNDMCAQIYGETITYRIAWRLPSSSPPMSKLINKWTMTSAG